MKATMKIYDDTGSDYFPCQLIVREQEMVVSYDTGGGPVIYRGPEVAPGAWVLEAPEVRGRATLYKSPISEGTFEGSWSERELGMWTIDVQEEDHAEEPTEEAVPAVPKAKSGTRAATMPSRQAIKRLMIKGRRDGFLRIGEFMEAFKGWTLDADSVCEVLDEFGEHEITVLDEDGEPLNPPHLRTRP